MRSRRGCPGKGLLFHFVLLLIAILLRPIIGMALRAVRATATTLFHNLVNSRAVAHESTRYAENLRPEHCENAEHENKG